MSQSSYYCYKESEHLLLIQGWALEEEYGRFGALLDSIFAVFGHSILDSLPCSSPAFQAANSVSTFEYLVGILQLYHLCFNRVGHSLYFLCMSSDCYSEVLAYANMVVDGRRQNEKND